MRDEARGFALVSLLYAVLTFVMAYPFAASPASQVLADAPDMHLFMWTLGWDAHAFLHQPWLIFDANIYHPYPNTLAYSENLIGSALFAAPIIWLTGDLVLALNLTTLLTTVLCGSGAYLLARRWGLSAAAAFVCGVIFAFAPPRFSRMAQLHMTAVQWIPFTLAFVHSYLAHGKRRDLLLALACFSLQVLSSGHGAAFLTMAVGLLIVWHLWLGRALPIRKWLQDCGATGLYLIAPSIWVMWPYRMAQVDAGLRREYPAEAMPGLTSFVASPSRVHTTAMTSIFGRNVNDEALAYLFPGFLCLALAIVAAVRWRRRSPGWDVTVFFAGLGIVSFLMFVTWPFDLWRLVYWMPGFNFIRVPSRFMVLVVLCLAMLSAVAIDRLTAASPGGRRTAIAGLISLLLLAEYSNYPFTGVPYAQTMPAIDRWLATQPGHFAIAEVPLPRAADQGAHERAHTRAMLHATAHWQKTVHGYSGIRRPLHVELYDRLSRFPSPDSIDALREVGVRYVVVHTDDYPANAWAALAPQVDASDDLEFVHAEGAGRIYAVRRPTSP